ncbi:MAG: hypothetical protein HC924_04575 [Synechococcaceae cyanobacterium SM2_3_2]|nr:hypothetical protein [Synechococcaceae cyanobacterium SM2_3_2]
MTRATQLYENSRSTVYDWLNRVDLRSTPVKRRKPKLDWDALRLDIQEHPEARLVDRAKKVGVHINAIWYAMTQMGYTRKKAA